MISFEEIVISYSNKKCQHFENKVKMIGLSLDFKNNRKVHQLASNASKAFSKWVISSFPDSSGSTEMASNLVSLSILFSSKKSLAAETISFIFFC
jgi:uncharacterized Fe-S cluster protein YjdI